MKEKGNREGRKQKVAGLVTAKDHLEEAAYICEYAYVLCPRMCACVQV